ncbi:hypothetical protein [Actinocrispum sp. NPDC049592]|uniref:hypothetical protein n=1 Tax=Actinocrispum sp. NPDC049592 TaxID=3154835 RepID=UPI0034425383
MPDFYGLEIDRAGVEEILNSPEVADAVSDAAEQVAEAARAQGHRVTSGEPLPIEVYDDPGTDRAGTTVAVPHAAGVGMEAWHGVLKRAASAAGLDVQGLDIPTPLPRRRARDGG